MKQNGDYEKRATHDDILDGQEVGNQATHKRHDAFQRFHLRHGGNAFVNFSVHRGEL